MVDETVGSNDESPREALTQAFTEAEEKTTAPADEPDYVEETPQAPETEQAPVGEIPSDEVVQEVKAAKHAATRARELKPPIDWSPDLRKAWNRLPPGVREAIDNRERGMNQYMQDSAPARKFADEVVRTLEPYRAVMAAEGVQNPLQAIDGLMRITATLQSGAKQHKAQAIANLVKHYGVDIETLDSALVGSMPKDDPQESRMEQMLNQRLAPVDQLLQRIDYGNQQQVQQLYSNAYQSIDQFGQDPQNEHFDLVRYDMANWLDQAAAQGRTMSLNEAYDRACQFHPEVSQYMRQRQGGGMMQKKAAASSLPARSNGSGGSANDMSMHDFIASQFGDGAGRI